LGASNMVPFKKVHQRTHCIEPATVGYNLLFFFKSYFLSNYISLYLLYPL